MEDYRPLKQSIEELQRRFASSSYDTLTGFTYYLNALCEESVDTLNAVFAKKGMQLSEDGVALFRTRFFPSVVDHIAGVIETSFETIELVKDLDDNSTFDYIPGYLRTFHDNCPWISDAELAVFEVHLSQLAELAVEFFDASFRHENYKLDLCAYLHYRREFSARLSVDLAREICEGRKWIGPEKLQMLDVNPPDDEF